MTILFLTNLVKYFELICLREKLSVSFNPQGERSYSSLVIPEYL